MNHAAIATTPAGPTTEAFPVTLRSTGGPKSLSGFLARWIVVLVIGFLAISTFEGALRYYAARAGLPWIVYIKDLLLIGALMLGGLNTVLTNLRNLPFLVVVSFLTVGTAIGVVVLPDVRQPLFAAKTWLPLLCGTVVGAAIDVNSKFLHRACTMLWIAAVAGVGLTSVWSAPWVGFVYEVGGVALEGSREWTIGDASRVPGFSRASFDVAIQCVFFGTIVVATARHYVFGLCVWLISAAAIFLTLSRSALVALAVAAGLHLLVVSLKSTQRLAKVAILGLAVGVLTIPFAAEIYYKNKAGVADTTSVASTSSFEERAVKTWPDGLALVSRGGNVVTGRGLGGVGVAQQFFESNIFNPGDNLFVYLWAAFGVCGGVFLAFIPFQAWRAALPLNRKRQTAFILVGAFLSVGLTLNGIEAAIASLFLGMALVWLTDQRLPE